jgi:hypothetical protein
MGQFKPMVKMETTEPSVELKLKKGGSVKKAMGGMMGAPMDATMASSMPARGGMMPVARPKRPTMAARRAAMMGMKEGGTSDTAQDKAMIKKAFKQHDMQEHKGDKGTSLKLKHGGMHMMPDGKMMKNSAMNKGGKMATGGVALGNAGGYKKGGMATGGVKLGNAGGFKDGGMSMVEKGGKMVPDFAADGKGKMKKGGKACATGGVTLGNAGGYKMGGKTSKKAYATGGAVNNSGHAVAYPAKKPSAPVSNDRQSGTFKKGGKVMMSEGGTTDASKGAYDKSIGPSESDMDMAKAIRSVPRKLYEDAKSLFTSKEKPSGSVTKTEKSVTVSPAKKRGGAVNC